MNAREPSQSPMFEMQVLLLGVWSFTSSRPHQTINASNPRETVRSSPSKINGPKKLVVSVILFVTRRRLKCELGGESD